jgi:hypothetical protein
MRQTSLIWGFSALASLSAGVASADGDKSDVLSSGGAAQNGAQRVGGAEMTAPPHASTATGQQPDKLNTDDTRRAKHPRNRSVVGPPPAAAQPKANIKTNTKTDK